MTSSGVDKALSLMRNLPRITFNALRNSVGAKKSKERKRGRYGGKTHGAGQKGSGQRQAYMRLGHEGGQTPFYMRMSKEPYYKGHHLKHEYLPISMHQIQMLIDTSRLNPEEPIDVTQICNTKLFKLDPHRKQYGFQITDEGLDCFSAKINLEIQYAPEHVIAAVEKNGGVITTAFYDMISLLAAANPPGFFKRGVPIPKRMLPPNEALVRFSDPKSRGYLADPDLIAEERFILSQKYGYLLPELSNDPLKTMLLMRKDPRQIFYGLEPGSLVSLRDRKVFLPADEELRRHYRQ